MAKAADRYPSILKRLWSQSILDRLPADRPPTPVEVKAAMDASANGAATPSVEQIAAVMGPPTDGQNLGALFDKGVFYRDPTGGIGIDPAKALNAAPFGTVPLPSASAPTDDQVLWFQLSMKTLAEPGAIAAMDNLEALTGTGTANDGMFGRDGMTALAGMKIDDPRWATVAPDVLPEDRSRYIAAAQIGIHPVNAGLFRGYSGGDDKFDKGELQTAAATFGPQAPQGPIAPQTPEGSKAVFYDSARILSSDNAIKAMDNLEATNKTGRANNGRFGTMGMQLLAGKSKDDNAFWISIDPKLTNPDDRQAMIDAANTALEAQYAPYLQELSGGDDVFERGEMRAAIADYDAHKVSNDAIDPSSQGQAGDCWVLASIAATAATPEGKLALSNAVYLNMDGSHTVTFPGDPSHPIKVTKADLDESRKLGFSSGDEDTLILETAIRKYAMANPAVFGQGNIANGGTPDTVLPLLSGQRSRMIRPDYDPATTKAWLEIIGKQSPTPAVSFSSVVDDQGNPSVKGNGANHGFAIQQIDLANNTVTFVNPWNSGKPITMTLDDLAGRVYDIFTTVPPAAAGVAAKVAA